MAEPTLQDVLDRLDRLDAKFDRIEETMNGSFDTVVGLFSGLSVAVARIDDRLERVEGHLELPAARAGTGDD